MGNVLQPWPSKLTREQRNRAIQRQRDFDALLKSRARRAGWSFARGTIFREERSWFVSNLPSLGWERGVWVRFQKKPMAIDPLFWEVVGLPENNKLPLSFRANGAWVLRAPEVVEAIATEEAAIVELAERVFDWCNDQLKASTSWSISDLLAELVSDADLTYQKRTLAVCLHLLQKDFDRAQQLCRQAGDQTAVDADSGGFTTHHLDGSWATFNQQALEWIAQERRKTLKPAV